MSIFNCGGRISVTREALAAALGLPDSIMVDIYVDWSKDVYEILLRSKDPVIVRGEQVTFPVNEAETVRVVYYTLPTTPVFLVQEPDEPSQNNLQNTDTIDNFLDMLDQDDINNNKSDSNIGE